MHTRMRNVNVNGIFRYIKVECKGSTLHGHVSMMGMQLHVMRRTACHAICYVAFRGTGIAYNLSKQFGSGSGSKLFDIPMVQCV